MPAPCPSCGAPLPAGARFCPSCGRPVDAGGSSERKLATVLFADLAGSTELAVSLDAETLRGFLAEVYRELSAAALHYGGTVEKFIGDAVMAVFGVPVAHEDDAERAVRAARSMRARMLALSRRSGIDATLRVGINTGPVVSGTDPARDFLVTGEAVNIAARLQQAAEPGEILLGERTFRAVEPVVRTVAPRSLSVRGATGPVTAYAVEGIAPVAAYRRPRHGRGPFVGRDDELGLLRTLVDRALAHRRAQLITVVGEPGIGKSRLAEELVIELQQLDEPPPVLIGRAPPYAGGGPYSPLREVLLRAAAAPPGEEPEELRARVGGHLRALLGDGREEAIAEVLRTIGLELDGRRETAEEAEEPEDDGGRSRDAWRDVLLGLARERPALLELEDAHLAEPALLDLLEAVVAEGPHAALVVLCLGREQLLAVRPTWGAGVRNSTLVTLEAIDEASMQRLAGALTSDAERARRAVERAGGNPFFLEEILAMGGEHADIPDTVQGVIAARIDVLPREQKRLLQRAAVAGRSFTVAQLEALREPAEEDGAARLVRPLEEQEWLVRQGPGFAFKHMLTREVAYQSLPRSERARLHLHLARWLEQQPDVSAQMVAGNYAAAASLGAVEARADAVRLLLEASQEARSVSAHGFALRQAERALSLAVDARERALAQEAIGDAQWMAEQGDEAWNAYCAALEQADHAGLPRAETARLAWKWVDLPTRWGALLDQPPRREQVAAVLERGLADARAAGDVTLEARLLVASALDVWRHATEAEPLEVGLESAQQALSLATASGREAAVSAALDAQGALLVSLNRYREARAVADRRLELVRRLPRREEQLDACSLAARARTLVGDFAAAVAATDLADELAAGGGHHWLGHPTLERMEALFLWDRWDDALAAYDRFRSMSRAGRPRRSSSQARAAGVAVAVHMLRGDLDRAELVEQRAGEPDAIEYRLLVAQALLGRAEPQLALERLAAGREQKAVYRPHLLVLRMEAEAMLGRWDELDRSLAEAERCIGLDQLPRLVAQVDRARGIAGDDFALERAAEGFSSLGCQFELARCLELQGRARAARGTFERLGAEPALARLGA